MLPLSCDEAGIRQRRYPLFQLRTVTGASSAFRRFPESKAGGADSDR